MGNKKSKKENSQSDKDKKIRRIVLRLLENQKDADGRYSEKFKLLLDSIPEKYVVSSRGEMEYVNLEFFKNQIGIQERLRNLARDKTQELYDIMIKELSKIANLVTQGEGKK